MQCIDGFSILLQRYVTKGNDAKNPAFLAFVCERKNPVGRSKGFFVAILFVKQRKITKKDV